jgi:signal transduction histidine kinase
MEILATVVPDMSPPVYLAILRDVSQRWEIERLRRQFTSIVGHELKNPLTMIRGYAELLKVNPTQARAADIILEQSDHLLRLIQDISDISRLEAGQLELRPRDVDLMDLVRDATQRAQTVAAGRIIDLDAPEHQPSGWWDADRVAQVLHNLLFNAIKYSPPTSTIFVRVRNLGEAAEIAVSNGGEGIPQESLSRLFDAFYRTEQAVESGAQGLGLGLYICKLLVEAHNGQLWVDSTPGAQTTFTFTLPYAARIASSAA